MIKLSGKTIISEEDFIKFVSESKTFKELSDKCNFNSCDGKYNFKLKNEIHKMKLSISHFEKPCKYKKVTKECPICKNNFVTRVGHPREKITCSHKCSNTYFSDSKHTVEANLKRSLKLSKNKSIKIIFKKEVCGDIIKERKVRLYPKKIHNINCIFCNKEIFSKKKTTKFCKNTGCAQKYRVREGIHKGWTSRDKLQPSFAEKVVIDIFNELNFKIEREYKVSKWFVDFADISNKIALEIDGKQHELPERKASDEVKDKYLIDNGWVVYRVKWKRVDKVIRQELKEKIKSYFNI